MPNEEERLKKAIECFTEAANRADPDAKFQLGQLYEKGTCGCKVNLEMAKSWYKDAVSYNHDEARKALERVTKIIG